MYIITRDHTHTHTHTRSTSVSSPGSPTLLSAPNALHSTCTAQRERLARQSNESAEQRERLTVQRERRARRTGDECAARPAEAALPRLNRNNASLRVQCPVLDMDSATRAPQSATRASRAAQATNARARAEGARRSNEWPHPHIQNVHIHAKCTHTMPIYICTETSCISTHE
jgi:hypothetical protein